MKNICIDPNRLALKIHTGIKQEASANFHKNPRIILNIDAILYFFICIPSQHWCTKTGICQVDFSIIAYETVSTGCTESTKTILFGGVTSGVNSFAFQTGMNGGTAHVCFCFDSEKPLINVALWARLFFQSIALLQKLQFRAATNKKPVRRK